MCDREHVVLNAICEFLCADVRNIINIKCNYVNRICYSLSVTKISLWIHVDLRCLIPQGNYVETYLRRSRWPCGAAGQRKTKVREQRSKCSYTSSVKVALSYQVQGEIKKQKSSTKPWRKIEKKLIRHYTFKLWWYILWEDLYFIIYSW